MQLRCVAGNDTGKTLTQSGIPLDLAAPIMEFDDDSKWSPRSSSARRATPAIRRSRSSAPSRTGKRAATVAVVAAEESGEGRIILTARPPLTLTQRQLLAWVS